MNLQRTSAGVIKLKFVLYLSLIDTHNLFFVQMLYSSFSQIIRNWQ